MERKIRTTSNKKPIPFNPDTKYPEFDKNATENIDGKNVTFLTSLLDHVYKRDIPKTLVNFSTLSPYDHHIRNAVSHNVALQLVGAFRPSWPLRVIEWLVIPDLIIQTCKEKLLTERYLAESLSAPAERKSAFFRVVNTLSSEQIAHMSKDAQNTIFKALQLMYSTPSSNER